MPDSKDSLAFQDQHDHPDMFAALDSRSLTGVSHGMGVEKGMHDRFSRQSQS